MKIDKNKYDTFVDLEKHKQILKSLDGKICYYNGHRTTNRRVIKYDGGDDIEFHYPQGMYSQLIVNIRIMDGIISDVASDLQWEIEFNDNQEALDRIKVLEEELAKLKKIIED